MAKEPFCDMERGESKRVSKDKKGRILKIKVGGLFLAAVILLPIGGALSQEKSPKIALAPESYNFGKIQRLGGKVSYSVTVRNQGDTPLTITDVALS